MRPDPTFFDPPFFNRECEEIFLEESHFTFRQRLGMIALALAAIFSGAFFR